MGVLDMLNLAIFCMSDGILSMIGAVYCSAPNFLYIKGALVQGKCFVFIKICLLPPICFDTPAPKMRVVRNEETYGSMAVTIDFMTGIRFV